MFGFYSGLFGLKGSGQELNCLRVDFCPLLLEHCTNMRQKIIRVGNSAAVTLSKAILEESNLEIGALASVKVDPKTKELRIAPIFQADSEIDQLTKKIIDQYRPALEELANK